MEFLLFSWTCFDFVDMNRIFAEFNLCPLFLFNGL